MDNREQINAKRREFYHENRERLLQKRRAYLQEHKEELRTYHQGYYLKLKMKVLSRYSDNGQPRCVRCGIDDIDVLCLDHINNDGNIHRKHKRGAGTVYYKWLRNHHFPKGFQVLCANCNLKKEIERRRESR